MQTEQVVHHMLGTVGAMSQINFSFFSPAHSDNVRVACRIKPCNENSYGPKCSFCASILEKSKMSLITATSELAATISR